MQQHPFLALLVIFVVPAALGYWHYTLRPYSAAAASPADRQRVVAPVMLASAPAGAAHYPAGRLLERIEPAPFGEWLLVHLVRRGMTVRQLARQLGRPAVEIHAVMYGAPVGTHLPSVALVDAICDLLQLDRAAARAIFLEAMEKPRSGKRTVVR